MMHLILAAALAPSINPPGGLSPEQVPQFVVLGSDDNHSDVAWFVKELAKRKHLDSSALKMSFYNNNDVNSSWADELILAAQAGHEIALHTASHPDMAKQTRTRIAQEIADNRAALVDWIAVPESQLKGYRTPFLSLSDTVLLEVKAQGLRYDCSLEEGWTADRGPRNYPWPYTLEQVDTSASWDLLRKWKLVVDRKLVNVPGLWEVPAYPLEIPHDSLASSLGFKTGLRLRMDSAYRSVYVKDTAWWTSKRNWKVTGFDYNLWFQHGVDGDEFAAVLLHNLKERMKGNRAPLTIGLHANYYTESDEERRRGMLKFLDAALQIPGVQFVSTNALIDWMENPSPKTALYNPQIHTSGSHWDLLGRQGQEAQLRLNHQGVGVWLRP